MSNIFTKGEFKPIDDRFIKDSVSSLQGICKVQQTYGKNDMDSLTNELHDSIVGRYLGFELVNIQKHGFDCKLNTNSDIFLESKVASYSSRSWNATFNDTTLEKADAFKQDNVWLALSIWMNMTDLLCICYGKNREIGDYLEQKVKAHQRKQTVRSTQSIQLSSLVFRYGFKILAPSLSKEILIQRLNLSGKGLKKLTEEHVIEFRDFDGIK